MSLLWTLGILCGIINMEVDVDTCFSIILGEWISISELERMAINIKAVCIFNLP